MSVNNCRCSSAGHTLNIGIRPANRCRCEHGKNSSLVWPELWPAMGKVLRARKPLHAPSFASWIEKQPTVKLPIYRPCCLPRSPISGLLPCAPRKIVGLVGRLEEHTSELQSHSFISY